MNSKTASVTRVVEGAEPIEFQMLFIDWKDPNALVGYNSQTSGIEEKPLKKNLRSKATQIK